jgi:hypothetical protein
LSPPPGVNEEVFEEVFVCASVVGCGVVVAPIVWLSDTTAVAEEVEVDEEEEEEDEEEGICVVLPENTATIRRNGSSGT